jgi:hypothetical protein
MKIISIVIFILATQFSCVFSQDAITLAKYGRTMKKLDVLVGGTTYPFLLDTGGGNTMITPELAAIACKKIYGKGVGYRMHGETATYRKCDGIAMKIGNTGLSPQAVAVVDLMSYLPPAAPRIYGLLSLDSFQDKIISLDLPAGKLTVETKRSARKKQKSMTLLDSRFPTGNSGNELDILVGVRRNDALYWFLFDTGLGSSAIISPQTAFDWGLQKDPASTGTTHKTEVSFGGRTEAYDFDAEDIIYDGAFNYDIVAKNTYLIDFVNKKMWMN